MDYGKFENLKELKDSIEIGLDIECFIFGERYYIGWSNHKRVIALCPDGDGDFFDTLEEMLDFQIEGKALKDIWQDIEIYSM
ncbi:hypothetical protein [Paenibacillus macquariensis]|uniref:Uncharacterized protein n=1 Tax=Paenibacillus macquariensis TaxID=948756 RepID=A0ABY1JX88_9BACL|nr:hypothetical protein [Paenibacillus macquariensis]MEC0089341.1 hypothetical protein [Paenibacillus macquariensis]OAB33257.1 hypothetical protein PMSM_14690 [Paenibacillus macquariensis subsp. macquariensis]SIQ93429.1 hypothetical protein SAMN05421578_105117 [Paenibacillus macquariensis]